MTSDPDLGRLRHQENLRLGRALAHRLAGEAKKIASTFDQLASIHEALARTAGHPLAGGAAERALAERRLAAQERVASVWFASIADGSYRPRPGTEDPPAEPGAWPAT